MIYKLCYSNNMQLKWKIQSKSNADDCEINDL